MAYGSTSASLALAAGLTPANASASVHMAELGTRLASGISHRRFGNIDWSVDTSEFLVALAASAGFLLALGSQGIAWSFVGALLAGGVVAAPIAAWLVRKITAGLLGAAVGGMIILTNVRTLFEALQVDGATREPVYAAVVAAWLLAIAVVVCRHRREGIALTNRELRARPALARSLRLVLAASEADHPPR